MTSRYDASWVCVRAGELGVCGRCTAQQSNGVNSHLCGSRMNESACSIPSYFGRSERANSPEPP